MNPSQSSGDVDLDMLRENVATYREAILEAMRLTVAWPCWHCGQPISAPEDGWWTATQLREATDFDGPAFMLAVNNLVRERVLEQDSRWRVRLAS